MQGTDGRGPATIACADALQIHTADGSQHAEARERTSVHAPALLAHVDIPSPPRASSCVATQPRPSSARHNAATTPSAAGPRASAREWELSCCEGHSPRRTGCAACERTRHSPSPFARDERASILRAPGFFAPTWLVRLPAGPLTCSRSVRTRSPRRGWPPHRRLCREFATAQWTGARGWQPV